MPPPQAQANRTDLMTPPVQPQPQGQPNGQPIQLPTGMPYGERQGLQQAQQAVKLPQAPQGPPQAPQGPPGGAGVPSGGAPGGVNIGAALQAAKQFQAPPLGGLGRPTERPNEPVTAGLPGSPQGPLPQQGGSLTGVLTRMAAASGSAALTQLAQRAGALNQ